MEKVEEEGDFQATGVVIKKKIATKKFKSSLKQAGAIDKNKFSIFGEVLDKKIKHGTAADDEEELETDLRQLVRLKKTNLMNKTVKSIDKPEKRQSIDDPEPKEPEQHKPEPESISEPEPEPISEPVPEPVPEPVLEPVPEQLVPGPEEVSPPLMVQQESISEEAKFDRNSTPKKKLILQKQLSEKKKPEAVKRLPGALDPKKILKFGSGNTEQRGRSSTTSSTGDDFEAFSLKSSSSTSSFEDQAFGSPPKDQKKESGVATRRLSETWKAKKSMSIDEYEKDLDGTKGKTVPAEKEQEASEQTNDNSASVNSPSQQISESQTTETVKVETKDENSRAVRSTFQTEKPTVGKLEVKMPAQKAIRKKEGKTPGALDLRKLGKFNKNLENKKSKFAKNTLENQPQQTRHKVKIAKDDQEVEGKMSETYTGDDGDEVGSDDGEVAVYNTEINERNADENQVEILNISHDSIDQDLHFSDFVDPHIRTGSQPNAADHSNDEDSLTIENGSRRSMGISTEIVESGTDSVQCDTSADGNESLGDLVTQGKRKPYDDGDYDNLQRKQIHGTSTGEIGTESEDGIPVDENMLALLCYLQQQENDPTKKLQILEKIERINLKLATEKRKDFSRKRTNSGEQEYTKKKYLDDQQYSRRRKYTDENELSDEMDSYGEVTIEDVDDAEFDGDNDDAEFDGDNDDAEFDGDGDMKVGADGSCLVDENSFKHDKVKMKQDDSHKSLTVQSLKDDRNTAPTAAEDVQQQTISTEQVRPNNARLLASNKVFKDHASRSSDDSSIHSSELYPIHENENEDSTDGATLKTSEEAFLEELKRRRRILRDNMQHSSQVDAAKYSKKHLQIEDIEETRMKNELQKLKRKSDDLHSTGRRRYDWIVLAVGEQIPACRKRGKLNHIIFWVDAEKNDDDLFEEKWLLISRGTCDDPMPVASEKWVSKAQGSDVMSSKSEDFKKFKTWSMDMGDNDMDQLMSSVNFECQDRKLWDQKYMPISKKEIFRMMGDDNKEPNCRMIFYPCKRYRYEESVHDNDKPEVFNHVTYFIRNVTRHLHIRSSRVENSIHKAIMKI